MPSMKTGGGHRPIDPGLSRGTDLVPAAVGEIKCLEERETETAQDGRRQLGKRTACLQGPKNHCLDQSPEGKADDLEQLWPVGSTCRRGASPRAKLCDESRW